MSNRIKYRTTLQNFRNRIKKFRQVKDPVIRNNVNRLDNTLRKKLFVNAAIDKSFYMKMMKYHRMSDADLKHSDVININWLNNEECNNRTSGCNRGVEK